LEYPPVSSLNLHSTTLSILKHYFDFDSFRPGQSEIIDQVIQSHDALVIMPTGGGKSLCYQIPALMLPGTALIISPLIALMKDQVDALTRRSIPAALINSTITLQEQQIILNDVQHGRIKLLYISPERLQNQQFMAFLRTISLSFIAVDEAHCISEWGHDFRPAYTSISNALRELPKRPPIIALTATATPEVQHDISEQLSLRSPFVHVGGFYRNNLHYQVVKTDRKTRWLIPFFKQRMKSPSKGAVIVYCGSRKRVEEYSGALQKESIPVLIYHAGLPDAQRQRVQEEFLRDSSPILFATNAFGMGVDKANVDCIIHCDITLTLEAYYQESGRAGRNGNDADCIVLYSPKDRDLMDFFLSCTFPKKDDVIAVYNVLFAQTPFYGYMTQPILLTHEQIGNSCGLHALKVNTILQLLERNGVLTNGSKGSNHTIRILAQSDYLKQTISSMSEHDRGIIMALLRTIGPEAMLRHVPFDIQKLLRSHHLQSVYVNEALSRFTRSGLIELGQSMQQQGISLLQQRFPPEEVPIDFDTLQRRHQHAVSKLNSVVDYMMTQSCKQRFLLDYFKDETSNFISCGTCSSCTSSQNDDDQSLDSREKFIRHSLLVQVAELNGYFGKKTILACVLGDEKDLHVKKYTLHASKAFGRLRGYPSFLIREALDDLIQKKTLLIKSGDYPVIKISEIGMQALEETVKPLTIRLHSTPMETLFKRLKKLRSEFANTDSSIHTFFSDASLKLMMSARPSSSDELQSLCGIPGEMATMYGGSFIAEINSHAEQQEEQSLSPTVQTTLAFIRQGYSLHRIAESRHTTIGTIARHIEQLIINGYDEECISMVPKSLIEEMSPLYSKMPYALLKHYRSELGDGYEFAEIRIALALLKKGIKL